LEAKEGRLHDAFSLLAETLIDVMLRLELEQMEASQPEQMESSWPASGETRVVPFVTPPGPTEPTEPNT
jgi:hypothetical protein